MNSQFLNSLYLEIFKAICTFLFGFISFKIFQRYKNKKDNNKLYIKIIKLEKEIEKNKLILEEIINQYIEEELLEKQFYINGAFNKELYTLYKKINSLNNYVYQEVEYDMGEPVDCKYIYVEKPYEIIQQLECAISSYDSEYYDYCVDDLEGQLEYYKKQNIYDELENIENYISQILINDFILKEALEFLYAKLKKYDSLSKEDKSKYLDSFCTMILDKENKSKVELEFKLWGELDIELLAVYNAESYLQIEELYIELNGLSINKNDRAIVEKAYNIISSKLEPIIVKHRKQLKRTLSKTNRLFSGI